MSQWPEENQPNPQYQAGSSTDADDPRQQVVDQITGQTLPADETIVLHGYRVGAEGKQILLDRLQAGQAPAADSADRPGFWRRVGCYLLDTVILIIPSWCVGAIIGTVFVGIFTATSQSGSTPFSPQPGGGGPPMGPGTGTGSAAAAGGAGIAIQGLAQLVIQFMYLAYFSIQHARTGQTIGKKAGGLRVVNMDLTPIPTGTAWVRGLYLCLPGLIIAPLMMFAAIAPRPMIIIMGLVSVAGGIYLLVNFIIGLADTQYQRTLHDRWAGTRVIWEH